VKFTARITHFLLPQESNNQKAKILHNLPLFLLIISLFFYRFFLQQIPRAGIVLGYAANISPEKVVELTNQERAKVGLSQLHFDPILANAALQKGADMLAHNYWAHISPTGVEPWTFFKNAGYNYKYAGENLARDFSSPESAVAAWMASPSHRENMLSPRYEDIGVAVVEGNLGGVETTIIVQLFGKRLSSTAVLPEAAKKEATPSSLTSTSSPAPKQFLNSEHEIVYTQPSSLAVVSPFNLSKGVSISISLLLASLLSVDAFLAWRWKIVRISGKSFAHLSFFILVIIGILAINSGGIL